MDSKSSRSSRSSWIPDPFTRCAALAIAFLCLGSGAASAFSGVVSPARFELKGVSGQVSRHVLEIGNDADLPDEFTVSTADWILTPDGGVSFFDELRPGSCRPWVRIERRSVKLPSKTRRKFRFEIHVPADAAPQECRLALMVEKANPSGQNLDLGNIQFPVLGRIGVIVYLTVGDVTPKLSFVSLGMQEVRGRTLPVAILRNDGLAHGRAEGILEGVDAAGESFEFTVSNSPILPGESRSIALIPVTSGTGPKPITPPLRLKGAIEWAGGKHAIDETLR